MAAASDLDAGTRAYLKQASDEVIRCRLYGHAWDPLHDGYIVEGRGPDRVYTQNVRCMRCETKGIDRFDPVTLDRIGTRAYDHADGYLVEGRQGRLARREVRQWVAKKAKAKPKVVTTGGRELRRAS